MATHNQHTLLIKPKGRTPADEYVHKGKTYIEGRENSHYVIELTNHSSVRKMAVVSVDGLSVTDGKAASFDSRGFVLAPYQTIQIPGWLLDDQSAAEFVFSKRQASYGNQTSSGGNEGVIGVAWFAEKAAPIVLNGAPVWRSHNTSYSAKGVSNNWQDAVIGSNACASAQTQSMANVTPSMGTAFGESLDFATTSTSFEKQSAQPQVVQLIYYDSAANLQRMGIKLKSRMSNQDGPQAFPGSTPDYCVPPPTWSAKRW